MSILRYAVYCKEVHEYYLAKGAKHCRALVTNLSDAYPALNFHARVLEPYEEYEFSKLNTKQLSVHNLLEG